MDIKEISAFYDDFVQAERDSGINDRIFSLYNRLLKSGMLPNSNILELGSGIGTLTFLLSKNIQLGKIEAVDLSPKQWNLQNRELKVPIFRLRQVMW